MKQETIELLIAQGWNLDCESPLELTHQDGSVLRGEHAVRFLLSLNGEVEQDDGEPWQQKMRATIEACERVFGDMAEDDDKEDDDVVDDGKGGWEGPRWTKEQRHDRVVFEKNMCHFLSERSRILGPPRTFKRLADTGLGSWYYQLDAVSEDGHYVVDFKQASYVFDDFNDLAYKGAAIKEWKVECARIACGCPGAYRKKFPRDHAFTAALFIYCDVKADVYQLPLSRYQKLQRFLAASTFDKEYPRLNFDRFRNNDDPICYVPTFYWEHIGNLEERGEKRFQARRGYTEVP